MKEKFEKFFNKYNGKPCEVNDPSNLNQCFDLAYAWCDELGVPRDAIRHLYASEIYSKPNDITVKHFEFIPNTPLAIPHIGDVVVFKGGVAGHVSIATGQGDTNTFESFDQNWNTDPNDKANKCIVITHAYDNVLGFLRFRQPVVSVASPITDQTKINLIIDPNGNPMEVQAIRSKLADQDNTIAQLKTQVELLYTSNLRYKENEVILNAQVAGLNTKLDSVQKELDSKPTNTSSSLLSKIHIVLWGKGFIWTKISKIKALLPK